MASRPRKSILKTIPPTKAATTVTTHSPPKTNVGTEPKPKPAAAGKAGGKAAEITKPVEAPAEAKATAPTKAGGPADAKTAAATGVAPPTMGPAGMEGPVATVEQMNVAMKALNDAKPLQGTELAFEEEIHEQPNRTLICTSFMVYVLFVSTSLVFAEYSFRNYDLDPTYIRTTAPPLGTQKGSAAAPFRDTTYWRRGHQDAVTTRRSQMRNRTDRRKALRPLLAGHSKRTNNTSLTTQGSAETEPQFEWDGARQEAQAPVDYVSEVLSGRRPKKNVSLQSTLHSDAPKVLNQNKDYVPEILEDAES